MSRSLVQLKDVSKVYGCPPHEVLAVDRVSLRLEAGRFIVLAGPSGCGKTTLLMVMGCLLQPTSGEVRICGEDVARLGEARLPRVRRKHIGFIFQGFNLFPALTALENVELALNLKGVRGSRARSESAEVLGRVGLEHRMHHLPADMSGGEKQRVAIARALVGDPEVLLADEPTAALDSVSGRCVVELLKGVSRREDRLVLVVSHDERILPYADEVWRMEDGRVSCARREGGWTAQQTSEPCPVLSSSASPATCCS
jgi:putative ABC transport system ATP-binding protein